MNSCKYHKEMSSNCPEVVVHVFVFFFKEEEATTSILNQMEYYSVRTSRNNKLPVPLARH